MSNPTPTNYFVITTPTAAPDYQTAAQNLTQTVTTWFKDPQNGNFDVVGGACFTLTPDGEYFASQAAVCYSI